MNITRLESYRKLKDMRDKIAELDRAMDDFAGELAELGSLLARRYLASYRAEELKKRIKTGADHES